MKKLFSMCNVRCVTCPQDGFTLVETLVAIFILALAIAALLTLTAGGYFSIRYSKNDIVATNLLQESLEYIRNTRDTAAQQPGQTWDGWFSTYSACDATNNSKASCIINPYAQSDSDHVKACSGTNPLKGCTPLSYYADVGMYGYAPGDVHSSSPASPTSFVRYITMRTITTKAGDPELLVTATIGWLNGTSPKSEQQSIILTKWNLP
ncbi:MAG TPA: prepilin-type N-terminal cleavage/methylation domain-containing protein [Candidatus Paceibacterota bacterium]|nr:prepilin-type N-terminal cleavage/methylation domain-containing protein [Candidatus Paceibacterota bacterium]